MLGVALGTGVEDRDTKASAAAALDPAQFVREERRGRVDRMCLQQPASRDSRHSAGDQLASVHRFHSPK
jgi:hypothetical protein